MRCQALLIQLLHNGWRYQEPVSYTHLDESASNSLNRWEGKSATVGQLMGMRYKGWESGYEDAFVYDLGAYRQMCIRDSSNPHKYW